MKSSCQVRKASSDPGAPRDWLSRIESSFLGKLSEVVPDRHCFLLLKVLDQKCFHQSPHSRISERNKVVGKGGSSNSCILITLPVFPPPACFNVFIISGTVLSRTRLSVGEVDNYPFIQLFTMNVHSSYLSDARHSSGHGSNKDEQKNSYSQGVYSGGETHTKPTNQKL